MTAEQKIIRNKVGLLVSCVIIVLTYELRICIMGYESSGTDRFNGRGGCDAGALGAGQEDADAIGGASADHRVGGGGGL